MHIQGAVHIKEINHSFTILETCYYKSQSIVRTTQGLLHALIFTEVK
jgi:hypothetical protein